MNLAHHGKDEGAVEPCLVVVRDDNGKGDVHGAPRDFREEECRGGELRGGPVSRQRRQGGSREPASLVAKEVAADSK